MRDKVRLVDYFFKFLEAFSFQLDSEQKKLASNWRSRFDGGQEDYIYTQFEQYWVEFSRDGVPIPWLKIAVWAMIGWVRDNHPEVVEK